jgi:hypothetical protein
METPSNRSMLEILPDEILLEVCKYLSCVEILQSFFGLNTRMTNMITEYRQHVSLHNASITQYLYLSNNVLPQIGSHIRSLTIDYWYSVLQNKLLTKTDGKKMSIMFPHLEKISLVEFDHDQLVTFLGTLHDLNHLVEIKLYHLTPITRDDQPSVLQTLLQTNNKQLTSILIDYQSSCLRFNDTDCYLNIRQLRMNITTVTNFASLFTVVPNVHYLDVTISESDGESVHFDKMSVSPLLHLIDFRLKSLRHCWQLEELLVLLDQLPNLQHLSLYLWTYDPRFVHGNIVLPLLPSTVQQFNYAIYYLHGMQLDRDDTIVASWPPSHPIACFLTDRVLFIYTLPWRFTSIDLTTSVGNMMSSRESRVAGYDRQMDKLVVNIDRNFTWARSLAVVAQCRRMRDLTVLMNESDSTVQGEYDIVDVVCTVTFKRVVCKTITRSLSTDDKTPTGMPSSGFHYSEFLFLEMVLRDVSESVTIIYVLDKISLLIDCKSCNLIDLVCERRVSGFVSKLHK